MLWVPFVKGFSEKLRKDMLDLDVEMAFKRGRTMRSLLTNLNPKKSPFQKPGVIYRIPFMDCDPAYIGKPHEPQKNVLPNTREPFDGEFDRTAL